MTFLSGSRLLLLVPVIGAVALLVWHERRRAAAAARFAAPEMFEWISPRRSGPRLGVLGALLLTLLGVLVVAAARPARTVQVPVKLATVIVALDRSTSMAATDVRPARIDAAKRAATEFVRQLPRYFRVGLVLFSGDVDLAVAPTVNHLLVIDAVQTATLADGTAIGDAVFISLDALTQDAGRSSSGPVTRPVYPRLAYSAIVLLSDGATTAGRPNDWAASAADQARVPVSTIAFGTDHGVLDDETSVPVDVGALGRMASRTGGVAFRAESQGELLSVFGKLGFGLAYHAEDREVTQWAVGIALGVALLTALLGLVWFARLP
jgi:Ca-activated chloride channel family protein